MNDKTVFVMDDSPIVLDVVTEMLEAKGFRVAAAANLAELELRLAEGKPDLVVLDVQMPEIFGDDVAQVLRHVRSMAAPIVLFSSLERAALEARVAEGGLDGSVCKDDGVPALVECIERMLAEPTPHRPVA